jgi:hypothetical protein
MSVPAWVAIAWPASMRAIVRESGWQWRPVDGDTAFAPPFGTVRACLDCGCLVAGGPARCRRCAADALDDAEEGR